MGFVRHGEHQFDYLRRAGECALEIPKRNGAFIFDFAYRTFH